LKSPEKTPDAGGRVRIVRWLSSLYPDVSPSRLKRAVLSGQVTVNGAVTTNAGALVSEGDEVVWEEGRPTIRRAGNRLVVFYEDDDAIIVFKPAGMLTQPTYEKERDTLLSRVSNYLASRGEKRPYVAVVHRLDKDTSGLLAFAKSRRGLHSLQTQLKTRALERSYLAVVEGNLAANSGRYEEALVEDRGDGRRGVARPGQEGLPALTAWKVVERFGVATLVEVELETGRTHQIRIHFAEAGHPVVGDPVYRDRRLPPFPVRFPRQALHAALLGFDSVEGGHIVRRAEPPRDFEALVTELRDRRAKTPDRKKEKPAAKGSTESRRAK